MDDGLIRLPHNGWAPRPYQRKLWNYLEKGGKRAVAIWHRRAGKDEVCLHWTATAAHTRVGCYWHMLPEASQARKAVWDAVNPHTGQRRINEAFPRELRESTRETDMAIRFKSGSLWQLVGSDNFNCFSDDTEILTRDGGWLLFSELTGDELVATLEGDDLVYAPIRKVMSYDYEGEMYRVYNNAIDLLTTPNHRFYVESQKGVRKFKRIDDPTILGDKIPAVADNKITWVDITASCLSQEEYSGKVWCVDAGSHVIKVRRNGKEAWCGNSLVGSPPIGVVFSEFALADPSAWGYLRPILAENGGWALFITTPRGRNHAATFYEAAHQDPTWFSEQLPATDTSVFTWDQLEIEHRELLREYGPDDGEARYRQEYLVSFDAGVMGSYYGSLMEAAEKEKRVTSVPHQATLPVHTAWDLGIGDATAIWCIQLVGQEIHVIDYIENSGVGLDWYVRELDKRPWKWGEHILPHDAKARELGTGRSRLEVLISLGFHRYQIVEAQKVEDGINALRMILPRMWFDAEKCVRLVSALQNYRRSWNDGLRTYSDRPLHDWTSHACDAGRMFALANVRNAGSARPIKYPDLAVV